MVQRHFQRRLAEQLIQSSGRNILTSLGRPAHRVPERFTGGAFFEQTDWRRASSSSPVNLFADREKSGQGDVSKWLVSNEDSVMRRFAFFLALKFVIQRRYFFWHSIGLSLIPILQQKRNFNCMICTCKKRDRILLTESCLSSFIVLYDVFLAFFCVK